MGRKKKRRSTSSKSSIDKDLSVIGLIVISILLFILIYGEKGSAGKILSPVLGGICGPIKYIIPIGFLAMGFSIIRQKKSYLISKLIQYIIFLGCIASILTIYQISKGNIDIENSNYSKVLEISYSLGETSIGGGTIGAVISYPLIKLLGMFGAAILSGGAAVALLVFTFGIRPSEIFLNLSDKIEEIKEEREDELEELRIRREEKKKNKDKIELSGRKNSKDIDEPAPITEEQITINLNGETEEKNKKLSIFGRKKNT